MHGRIFEIREERLPREEWMNETYFYDEDTSFADYYKDSEDREGDLQWLKQTLPPSMFRMEGDEIEVISDGKEVIEKWIERMKEEINKLDYESVLMFPTTNLIKYKMKGMLHEDFMFCTDYADYCHDSTEFAKDCINNYQGKKLYVCGIIDYHW